MAQGLLRIYTFTTGKKQRPDTSAPGPVFIISGRRSQLQTGLFHYCWQV
jgi:hypothetical protein